MKLINKETMGFVLRASGGFARTCSAKLMPKQQDLWRHFFGANPSDMVIAKSDIQPSKFPALLPNLFMLGCIHNDQGQVVDLVVRLLGTKFVSLYGEFTGIKMLSDSKGCDFFSQNNLDKATVLRVVNKISDKRLPYFYRVRRENDTIQFETRTFILPVALGKGADVSFVFGCTDILRQTN